MSFFATKNVKTPIPQLLAPVGNEEQLDAALIYGADAVYLGGSMSLRASRFFSEKSLALARLRTREAGVEMFFCCNAFPRPHTWREATVSLEAGAKAEVDAFIIADAGLIAFAQRHFPHIPIHLSTQANTCNAQSVLFWQEQGISRVNLARELRLTEILAIRRACPDMEIECFVHGAQCLAISGQCLLSAWLNDRPANEGQCTQPCRFSYKAMPESVLVVGEDIRHKTDMDAELWHVTQGTEGYSAFWAPEDLCLLPFLPWFVQHGIHTLKIEGRMRNGIYVAHALDAYRTALTSLFTPQRQSWQDTWQKIVAELRLWSARPLGSGFFARRHQQWSENVERGVGGHSPVLARIEEPLGENSWRVSVRGRWNSQTDVQLLLPGGDRPVLQTGRYVLENMKKLKVETLHSGTEGIIYCDLKEIRYGVYVENISAESMLD